MFLLSYIRVHDDGVRPYVIRALFTMHTNHAKHIIIDGKMDKLYGISGVKFGLRIGTSANKIKRSGKLER